MKKLLILIMLVLMPCVGFGAEGDKRIPSNSLEELYYRVPPSSTTYSSVPYISDEAMEQCVILYNKAEQLEKTISSIKINQISVDRYNQNSVDNYNRKVSDYNKKAKELSIMTDSFNRECAGKQSESAYRAAEKLNQELMNQTRSKQ